MAEQAGEKIAKSSAGAKFLSNVDEGVNSLWQQTWRASKAGADVLTKKIGRYLLTNEQLPSDQEEGSKEKIEATIKALEELKDCSPELPRGR